MDMVMRVWVRKILDREEDSRGVGGAVVVHVGINWLTHGAGPVSWGNPYIGCQ